MAIQTIEADRSEIEVKTGCYPRTQEEVKGGRRTKERSKEEREVEKDGEGVKDRDGETVRRVLGAGQIKQGDGVVKEEVREGGWETVALKSIARALVKEQKRGIQDRREREVSRKR